MLDFLRRHKLSLQCTILTYLLLLSMATLAVVSTGYHNSCHQSTVENNSSATSSVVPDIVELYAFKDSIAATTTLLKTTMDAFTLMQETAMANITSYTLPSLPSLGPLLESGHFQAMGRESLSKTVRKAVNHAFTETKTNGTTLLSQIMKQLTDYIDYQYQFPPVTRSYSDDDRLTE
jgi:hypothetical protein